MPMTMTFLAACHPALELLSLSSQWTWEVDRPGIEQSEKLQDIKRPLGAENKEEPQCLSHCLLL